MNVAPATPSPRSLAGNAQRFAPGTLLASRYRIVSRLGKGGMGEVFRADDIVLGQPVALKFLPETAKANVNLLTRFYDEVRIARQISHANVCRVYDIGEIEGQPYLSMEYIDGEDLSSLLRRIGRLPGDKAAELARKMCAGLAAAHAQGVLHRDIKPGNIMIDGRGEPRITDFGLAALASGIEGAEIRNGTPAYMAPEQLEGREVSAQSDIYALGLVFHEMFTGKPPHDANTVAELTSLRKASPISKASTLVGDLDPAVDRAIQACLQPDPKMRPKSALDLARMLPGGDPLAAALAAGQTPSPEMVAASGSTGALSPKVAAAVLTATVIGLLVAAILTPIYESTNRLPLQKPPEVIEAQAQEILHQLGYTERHADSAMGIFRTMNLMDYLGKEVKKPEAWDDVLSKSPTLVQFWYRESPNTLRPTNFNTIGRVATNDPPMTLSGMTVVLIGLDGRLYRFSAVPPQVVDSAAPATQPDWGKVFSLAHLDIAAFESSPPEWTPLAATDTRLAWTGKYPNTYQQPVELPIRVEAASFAGKPVYFEIIFPGTKPARAVAANLPLSQRLGNMFLGALILLVIVASCVLARLHWKTGKGDRRGAVRVGAYVAVLQFTYTMLRAHPGNIDSQLGQISDGIAAALLFLALYWVFYLALEPWVRRYWPQVLVTWTRVLQGHWTDPLVGRDALFAVALGVGFHILVTVATSLVRGVDSVPNPNFELGNLLGVNQVLGLGLNYVESSIIYLIGLLMLLLLLRMLLRKQWLAAAAFVLIGAFVQSRNASATFLNVMLFNIVNYSFVIAVMLRLGIFAAIVMVFTANMLGEALLTTNYSAWYGTSSWLVPVLALLLAIWGYRVSTAGQSLFGEAKPNS